MIGAGRSPDTSAEPKRPRHAGGGDAVGAGHPDDRLSALPDDLLHAIMSRLKALQTVRTCVLSTRWRHLWCAVPCLAVDEDDFIFTGKPYFDPFTTGILGSHDLALLEDFRLHGSTISDHLVRRATGQEDTWPCRLKRLHLSGVNELKLTDLASHISSRCPAMEDVQLTDCSFLLTRDAKIASSSLKKLVVDGYYMDMVYDDEIFSLIIEAPALVSLSLGAWDFGHTVTTAEPHTMPSLVDASIHLHLPMFTDGGLTTTAYSEGLLATLYNVTSLHLTHVGATLLRHKDYRKFPVFENLRTLSMDECCIADDFMGLEPYLRNSRNLQKLTLRRCKVMRFRPKKDMKEQLPKSSENLVDFKCDNLRLSEIIYQDGDASVHLLVKFLVGLWRNLPNNKIELIKADD